MRSAELSLRQDHLGRHLDCLFQQLLLALARIERLALDDADRRQDTAQLRIDGRDRLVVENSFSFVQKAVSTGYIMSMRLPLPLGNCIGLTSFFAAHSG